MAKPSPSIVLTAADDGRFTATSPAFPELTTRGWTAAECLERSKAEMKKLADERAARARRLVVDLVD